ncbi:hypothetical protein HNP46_006739 [Pseudomonas nitritireducens]|uniref:Uncharacterized protein n=1 Tax=Pseudomonas nitroreducens TaxID=46680 RepID=A0A7W7KRW5_PSENT|nr:hypothetical protein [Pseudomonas nitritireducens]MBB4867820.1 hypothetical protein [Pseudomonas nitritireducens]
MSEWEEFCESRGFSTGEEDYDKVIDSLGGRSSTHRNRVHPPCDLTQEQVNSRLKRQPNCQPGEEVDIVAWGVAGVSDAIVGSLDGAQTIDEDDLLLRFGVGDYEFAPASMLIENLRSTRQPIVLNDEMLVWDERFQCLDAWSGFARERLTVQIKDNRVLQEKDQALIALQNYAKITDHGSRPILVAGQDLERALEGGLVEILDASTLSAQALSESHLVCLDTYGIPASISLRDAHEVLAELLTRSGTYKLTGGVARPVNGPARLTAGAITMATTSASQPCYYRLNEHATVYKPAFWKIDESEVASHSPSEVYVTDGPHPLELGGTRSRDRYVTTMEYFERYGHPLDFRYMAFDDVIPGCSTT